MMNKQIFFLKRRKQRDCRRRILTVFLLFICLLLAPLVGKAENLNKIGVISSLNIKPYAEAVEGINEVLHENGIRPAVFFLENYSEDQAEKLKDRLSREDYNSLIAVGPEASRFIWSEFRERKIRLLYTMVLHPEQLEDAPVSPCGISMSIPVPRQTEKISHVLPEIRRIGLLYDPRYNQSFFEQSLLSGTEKNFRLIPLAVSSRKEIPEILEKNWENVDCLWMIPDRTIISESIIQYIIKEALLHRIPVLGYNRFFWESGAVMSFVFDYKELGKQTGKLALRLLQGEECPESSPDFQIWLNEKVLQKLGTVYKEPQK